MRRLSGAGFTSPVDATLMPQSVQQN